MEPTPIIKRRIKVFVSSTSGDLRVFRAVTRRVCTELGLEPIMMEDFDATPLDGNTTSLAYVNKADLYVGIFGQRYGFIPSGSQTSVTHNEFTHAGNLGLMRLCFVVDDKAKYIEGQTSDVVPYFRQGGNDYDGSGINDNPAALNHFIQKVVSPSVTYKTFASVEQFERVLRDALDGGLPSIEVVPDQSERDSVISHIRRNWTGPKLRQIQVMLESGKQVARLPQSLTKLTLKEGETATEAISVTEVESIHELFKQANYRLIVLGEPGVGKTIALALFAEELLAEAEVPRFNLDDTLHRSFKPLPFLLSLADWVVGQSLEEWVKAELIKRYGMVGTYYEKLVSRNEMVLLLDGLDQVPPEHRPDCVTALNVYLEAKSMAQVVITCRTHEFESLTESVLVNMRLTLHRLERAQIVDYLAKQALAADLIELVASHARLLELAAVPIFLNMVVLIIRREPERLRTLAQSATLSADIFTVYFDLMFGMERDIDFTSSVMHPTRPSRPAWPYTPTQTKAYLEALARNMDKDVTGTVQAETQRETLYIEDMQPAMISDDARRRRWFDTSVAVLAGMVGGVAGAFAVTVANRLFIEGDLNATITMTGALAGGLVGAMFGGMTLAMVTFLVAILASLVFPMLVGADAVVAVSLLSGASVGAMGGTFAGVNKRLWSFTPVDITRPRIQFRMGIGLLVGGLLGILFAGIDGYPLGEAVLAWLGFMVLGVPLLGLGLRVGDSEPMWWFVEHFVIGVIINHPQDDPLKHIREREVVLQDTVVLQPVAIGFWTLVGLGLGVVFQYPAFGLAVGLIFGVLTGRVGNQRDSDTRRKPNEGVLRSVMYSLLFAGVLFGLGFALGTWLLEPSAGIQLGLAGASAVWLAQGGYAFIQHLLLRGLLVQRGDIPPNVRAFLDFCVTKTYLVNAGNGYQFLHQLWREYLKASVPPPKG